MKVNLCNYSALLYDKGCYMEKMDQNAAQRDKTLIIICVKYTAVTNYLNICIHHVFYVRNSKRYLDKIR